MDTPTNMHLEPAMTCCRAGVLMAAALRIDCLALALMLAACSSHRQSAHVVYFPAGAQTGVIRRAYIYESTLKHTTIYDSQEHILRFTTIAADGRKIDAVTLAIVAGYLHWQPAWVGPERLDLRLYDGDPAKDAPEIGTWHLTLSMATGKITHAEWQPVQP